MVNFAIGLGLSTACIATALPQVIGLSWYREALASYKNGVERPIDKDTQALIPSVMDELKVKEDKRPYFTFFTCFDNNPLHRGGGHLRSGAIIGIPQTFSYKSPDDINKNSFTVSANQRHIDWDTKAGKNLEESLVLTENAKKFAIGREINYSLTSHIYTELIIKLGMLGAASAAVTLMDNFLQMKQRMRRSARYGVFSLVGSGFLIIYLIVSDTYSCWRDYRVDLKTARASKDLAEGGLEFYEKLLQRNQAIRGFMGQDSGKFYTAYGNEIATWRSRHLQLTARRDVIKNYLKDIQTRDAT